MELEDNPFLFSPFWPLRGERDAGCQERSDGHAGEGAEGGAGGARSAFSPRQATRRHRAGGWWLHGAIVRAHLAEREPRPRAIPRENVC